MVTVEDALKRLKNTEHPRKKVRRDAKTPEDRARILELLARDEEGRVHLTQAIKALIRSDKWKRRRKD